MGVAKGLLIPPEYPSIYTQLYINYSVTNIRRLVFFA